jgi:environmental stress-induced protein Ves/GNAT superfamily N-acetyltransferase
MPHSGVTIMVEAEPHPEEVRSIREGLSAFNLRHTQDDSYEPLPIFLRDGDELVGGLLAATYWGWLHLDILWIDERFRGQGYGETMLARAEAEASLRGCHHAHLDTLSFQALPFYQRHGYTIFGALPNHPTPHTRYFLQKSLHGEESSHMVPRAAQAVSPWRGGEVREIYKYPASADFGAGDYHVWVGTATIERSADYSYFPARYRLHMPMTGNGIELHFREPEEVVHLAAYDLYQFDGARPLHARLVDGPITAFNLILKHAVSASVTPLMLDRRPLPLSIAPRSPGRAGTLYVIYAVAGVVHLSSAGSHTIHLDAGDAFIWRDPAVQSLNLHAPDGRAQAIVAEILLPEQEAS